MIDDRNLTVHTYNEPLAEAIYGRLGHLARVLRKWLDELMEQPSLGSMPNSWMCCGSKPG